MSTLWGARSISAKLMRMNFLVSATALVLASVSFLGYDAYSFRQNLLRSLHVEAEIIGSNCVTPLLFDDHVAARSTLQALADSPAVVSATIVGADGRPFAEYTRGSAAAIAVTTPLNPGVNEQQWKLGNQMLLASRIQLQGKTLGTVYILAETDEVGQRARRYILIALLVLLICLGLALLVTASLRRVIAGPIVELAKIAQKVTKEKDYSIRAAPPVTEDEISVLVNSFNEMLGQIQARDQALLESRDVLEQRVAERTAELQAANREMEAFSYSVAHDLRGPLDALGNATFMLRHSQFAGMDEATRDLLLMLPRMTERMSSLIDDLLNLSRSKSSPLHLEPVDLCAIARTICEELVKEHPERRVELDLCTRGMAIADQGLMRVMMANLLGNAWKYSSKVAMPKIEFGTRQEGDETVFYVRDNGAGFDPGLKDRLFKPFERLHTQSEFSGTGVGLATVQRIIARHGGRIWAESEVDQGATFSFTLGNADGSEN
jgi:signal transduction histidine kinase